VRGEQDGLALAVQAAENSAYTDALAHLDSWNCSSSSSAIRRDAFDPTPNSRPWKYRFSQTVSWRSRVFCWETIPLSCLARAGCAAISTPARNARPDVGTTRVVSIPAVVVFPAPLGPSRPKISPDRTSRLRWSTAAKSAPA
jgi:hypothetical protein